MSGHCYRTGLDEAGGDTLIIEVTLMKGKGKLLLTGKLGDVMRNQRRPVYLISGPRTELNIDEDFHENTIFIFIYRKGYSQGRTVGRHYHGHRFSFSFN